MDMHWTIDPQRGGADEKARLATFQRPREGAVVQRATKSGPIQLPDTVIRNRQLSREPTASAALDDKERGRQ
jgi:hypothetical protein